jgi:DNA-binding NarL/FixJ family response regulator
VHLAQSTAPWIQRAERDLAILTLRANGAGIRAIAAEIGCSAGTVHRTIKLHPQSLRLISAPGEGL